jgi:Domain of unknown function (DUF4333)
MPKAVRTGAASAVALIALALSACGGTVIDEDKAEDAVKADVEQALDVKVESVDCPSDVDVEAGTSFDCTVEAANGLKATATLKILNEDADVRFVNLKPQK